MGVALHIVICHQEDRIYVLALEVVKKVLKVGNSKYDMTKIEI
ncbi:hypothetical protein [Acetivibrio cellulolyticus]